MSIHGAPRFLGCAGERLPLPKASEQQQTLVPNGVRFQPVCKQQAMLFGSRRVLNHSLPQGSFSLTCRRNISSLQCLDFAGLNFTGKNRFA
ncbi:hypothetical protein [Thiolapillus sp.]|uniref:hypothetical protein n=1 Tax=Thiolapillus sp. TaxID=2017437 RepID=UPI003AF74236